MKTQQICKECGSPLSPEAPEGLCPKCLLKVAMGTQAGTQPGNDPAPGAAANPLPDPAKLAEYFPQLEILELLGQGGMGAVYKARQPALDRLVALKILPPQAAGDPGFAERFNREARALAKLSHPNIVAVYDFGQTHGLHYFLMEYVDGLNLRQLERASKLSPRQALQIIPQICEALQFAHDEGIVHRDIKPENVLVDKKGRIKIADFGLARILGLEAKDLRLTGAKDIMGTPHYMAPEQVEHPQEVDHRADIYSLGVVFYEMLTGELPLGRFAPPSRKVQVDVRLDEVVLHALEKEPERRYQQASQVKTDLETIATRPAPAPAEATVSAAIEAARAQVKGPAIGLVAIGILNWIAIPVALLCLFYALSSRNAPGSPPFIAALLALLCLSAAILVAGLKMKHLEAYPLAVAGSILAMLIAPANVVGLPVGIWALVVLTRKGVRQAFGQPRPLPPPPAPQRGGGWKIAAVIAAAVLLLLAIPIGATLAAIAWPALSRAHALHDQQALRYVVSGVVTDATTGKPLPGARVADNFYGARPDRAPQETWTDATGHYELKTWSEEHTLAASAPGYEPKLATLLPRSGHEPKAQIDFQLQPVSPTPRPAASRNTIIQSEVLDLQPDGVIRFEATSEVVNPTDAPWPIFQFMNSDFVTVEKMLDGSQRPLAFQTEHQGGSFHYSVTLNAPVAPGERLALTTVGTMAGLIQPTAESGVYRYSMRHWPTQELRTRRIEVHRLPAGAQLLDKEPAEMHAAIRQGRLELSIDRLIPPGDSLEINYRYRLNKPTTGSSQPGT